MHLPWVAPPCPKLRVSILQPENWARALRNFSPRTKQLSDQKRPMIAQIRTIQNEFGSPFPIKNKTAKSSGRGVRFL